ncbi:recQ [Mytilus edulis]|uniref:RecQ n=1 Tax=Mytilus edulis TaxID=6550 RepID=A0A8S3SLJ5_MYTED|nr:recQ [Mytilus edulis]
MGQHIFTGKAFRNGVVIVVSPLNSSLYEQLDRYRDLAIHFNKFLYKSSGANIPLKVKYVIGHPEQIVNKGAFQLLKCELRDRTKHIIVDEAYCVVQWGNGFHEQYYELIKLRSLFPSAKLLALSATATKEIVKRLRMKGAGTIVGNVDRPAIKLVVSTRPAGCGGKLVLRTLMTIFTGHCVLKLAI